MHKKSTSEKAASMAAHTEELRKACPTLPREDHVIQKYGCAIGFTRGTLWITNNHAVFTGKLSDKAEIAPLSLLEAVEVDKGLLTSSLSLRLRQPLKTLTLSDFHGGHAKEAHALLAYLWNNPVHRVDLAALDEARRNLPPPTSSAPQLLRERAKVDTAAADELLRLARETETMQSEALRNLHSQGEQLDRIEGSLEHMAAQLDRADHLMKGIESVRYYLFGGKGKQWGAQREAALKTRQLPAPAPGRVPVIEVEVLYKKQDDSLLPAILVFEPDMFKVVPPDQEGLIDKGTKYRYADVVSMAMRARHEHVDVRFSSGKKDPSGRLRLMSSYLQLIVNQLYLRGVEQNGGKGPQVEWEPGVVRFDYTDPRLPHFSPLPRAQPGAGGAATSSAFVRPGQAKLSSLTSTATEEQKRDLDRVDAQLDEVLAVTRGIRSQAGVMSEELDRQNEQLGRVEGRVDVVTDRTQQLNKRMDKQLK